MGLKFLLFGTTVGGNYGCDAIVLGTEKILHQRFPDCEVLLSPTSWRSTKYDEILGTNSGIICNNNMKDRASHFCRRLFEKSKLLKVKIRVPDTLVRKSDCVLSIGGDLYTFANKEKDWPYPYSIVEAGNKIIQLGKPYIIWCASIGPLEKAGNRLDEVVAHLKSCRAIIVREQESYIYLRETIGIKNNVYLAADPAFVMEPESFDFKFIKEQYFKKLLAINFSLASMEHVYGHLPVEEFQSDLINFVKKILEKLPIRILFIPHVMCDYKFLAPIYEQLSKIYLNRIQIIPKNIGAQRTKWAVSQANALLTMRFHCSLAGFSTKTPTMVLVSTSKGSKICKEMYDSYEYGVNIKDMNKHEFIAKLSWLLDNEEVIKARLAPRCEAMKTRALSAGEILSKVM